MKDVEEMSGRELDEAVAREVMGLDVRGTYYAYSIDGWSVCSKEHGESWIADGRGSMQPVYVAAPHWLTAEVEPDTETVGGVSIYGLRVVPFYSTDIAAAWEVVERMRALGWEFVLWSDSGSNRQWQAEFEGSSEPLPPSFADDAPLAICRAALKAVRSAPTPSPKEAEDE